MKAMKRGVPAMLLALNLACCAHGQTPPDTPASIAEEALREAAVPSTPSEKREALLTPGYYTKWLGASFFTIASIEKELDVKPVQIYGLTFFYDFGSCFVGMEALENGVIVQMTVRLYGDMATDFVQRAVDYGYEPTGNSENVNVRSNGGVLQDVYGTNVKRYRIGTKNGHVYMEVSTSGRYANEYEITIYRAE